VSGSLLEANDLTIGYPGGWRLPGIRFAIQRGQFWVLLGPNGAGKSTLLRTIIGAHKPIAGSVRHAARGLGYVPQNDALDDAFPLTAAEVVGLAAPRLTPERVEKALEAVSLLSARHLAYRDLSGGQKDRAPIARALVTEPELLILDEPTSGLDLVAQHEVHELVRALMQRRSLSVLLVTHQLSTAASYGTHVAVISHPRQLFRAGPIGETLASEALEQTFGRRFHTCSDGAHHFVYLPMEG
jgi:ABC-type Mn2+/Zn2+ transport system ATPase subunit